MNCRNCIFPRNCENHDENKCQDCEKYDENAVPIGNPIAPDHACFKCKHEEAGVIPK